MSQAKNVLQSTNKNAPVSQGRNVELLWNKSVVVEDLVLSITLMMVLFLEYLVEELGVKPTTNPRGRSLGMVRGHPMLLSSLIVMVKEPDRGHPDQD